MKKVLVFLLVICSLASLFAETPPLKTATQDITLDISSGETGNDNYDVWFSSESEKKTPLASPYPMTLEGDVATCTFFVGWETNSAKNFTITLFADGALSDKGDPAKIVEWVAETIDTEMGEKLEFGNGKDKNYTAGVPLETQNQTSDPKFLSKKGEREFKMTTESLNGKTAAKYTTNLTVQVITNS